VILGFYSSNCDIQLIRTVIALWSKEQVSNLLVRSSQLKSILFYIHFWTLQRRILAIWLLYGLHFSWVFVCVLVSHYQTPY